MIKKEISRYDDVEYLLKFKHRYSCILYVQHTYIIWANLTYSILKCISAVRGNFSIS